ncbi:hypothetical protein ACTFIV_008534 [Dictyostelium citrinum]
MASKDKKFNSDNESIFWRVIHNVYLLKLILEKVEVVGNDSVDMFRQTKFKHITSMEWMLKKKQIELLKCKLKANEYIDLSKIAFQKLFKLNSNNNNSNNNNYNNNNNNKNNNNQYEITEQLLKEIMNLLFEKKKLELLEFDLLSIALEINNKKSRVENYEAVSILLNEPFSMKVFPSVVEWAILNCSYQMVEILINSPNLIITEEIKNRSISLAFTRNNSNIDKESIIRLLLNNPQLYNSNSNNDNFQSITTEKPSIDSFLLIKDLKIINQLLNLYYFKCSNEENFKQIKEIIENDKSENKIKEIFKLIVKIDKKNYNDYLLKYLEPIEELDIEYLEIVIRFSFLYFEAKTFKWVISKTIISSSTSPIRNDEINFPIVKQIIEGMSFDYKINYIKRELESTYEFIEFYTKSSQHLSFRNSYVEEEIKLLLLSSKTSEEYERIYNSISPKSKIHLIPISSYPKCWNRVLIDLTTWNHDNSIINIDNKESFDWILENCNGFLLKEKLKSFKTREIFQFESLELIQYAIDKFENVDKSSILYFPKSLNGDSYFYRCLLYHQTYINAINNCDIDTLKFIEENVTNFKLVNEMVFSKSFLSENYKYNYYNNYYNSRETTNSFNLSETTTTTTTTTKTEKTTTIENQEKLINYLNNTGYRAFNEKTFEKFLIDFKFNSDNIKIKFNDQFQQYSIRAYKNLSPFLMTKVVNGFSNDFQKKLIPSLSKLDLNSLFTNNSIFSIDSNDNYYEFEENYDFFGGTFISTSDQNPNHVIQCIETLIKFYKITSTSSTSTIKENLNDINSMVLHKLINRLFRCLIKIENVKFKEVENIRKLILENSISLEHSLFHSFYYLGLKSSKLIQYILKLPFLPNLLISRNKSNYNSEKKYNHKGYDIGKYLKSNIFTWEFIFGSGINSSNSNSNCNSSNSSSSGNSNSGSSSSSSSSSNSSNHSLDEFVPSFSMVLERLIHEVSHLPYFTDGIENGAEKDYLFKTFNYNLEYLLEIKRADLFFNELNYIQNLLKDKTIPLGSFPSFLEIPKKIIEDNTIFKNNYFLRDVHNEIIKDGGYYIYFIISTFIFKNSLYLMDTQTLSIFVKSYSYLSFINYLSNIRNFNNSEVAGKRVLDLVLEHSQLINQIINNQFINSNKNNNNNNNNYNKNNLKNFWNEVFKNTKVKEYIIIKYSNFFFDNNSKSDLIDLILEKLDESGKFNITLRELVLKNFPNHYYFQINEELLNQAYLTSNVNFINYLYDYGYLNQDNIQFLKLKLNSKEYHHPFRFINFLL